MMILRVSAVNQNKQQNNASFGTKFSPEFKKFVKANFDKLAKSEIEGLKALKKDGKDYRILDIIREDKCTGSEWFGGVDGQEEDIFSAATTLFLRKSVRSKYKVAETKDRFRGYGFSKEPFGIATLAKYFDVESIDNAEKSRVRFKTSAELEVAELRKNKKAEKVLKAKNAVESNKREKDKKELFG